MKVSKELAGRNDALKRELSVESEKVKVAIGVLEDIFAVYDGSKESLTTEELEVKVSPRFRH